MGEVLLTNQDHPSEDVLSRAVYELAAGGVVVMPTDSVYGIGCAAFAGNPAHQRIFSIKHRDPSQTLPWLVADFDDLTRYAAELPPSAFELVTQFWPGALTLVVRASEQVPPEYRGADGTIALRMPDSHLVRELSRRVGMPLATTSANTHGEAAATSGSGVEARIVAEADLTLDAGPAPLAIASTIVSLVGTEPRVLREGAIPAHQIIKIARA
ncbi:MAG: threonylcarbamoyl-AMP synthase [Atopobiaceae bacterium]|nr:threonylcarbamoyl-AMP synthase [Atopobiaceae bacterium]